MPDYTKSERPGARDAIQRTAEAWTKAGMDPKKAQEKAREKAIEHDRRNP